MKPTTYTVQQGDTLNGIANRYGFSDYKQAGISSVPSGNFDLIRPGESITIPNYKPPVQQTTTTTRNTAQEGGTKLDGMLTSLAGGTGAGTSTVGDDQRTGPVEAGNTAQPGDTRITDGKNYKYDKSMGWVADESGQIKSDMDKGISDATAKNAAHAAYVNDTLDSIKTMSSAATNALIESTKQLYGAKIKLMEDSNMRLKGAKEQAGIRSGRAKYVNGVHQGIMTDEEQKGIDRIALLQGNMLTLIAQAEQARTDKDLEIFNKRMTELDASDKELQTSVQNLRKNAFDSLQEMRLRDKAESDIEKQQFDMMIEKSERSAPAVAAALAQFTNDDEKAAFIIQYAEKQGIDPSVLMGDIEAALDDKAKAELDLVNIKSQIQNRTDQLAVSRQNAGTSAYNAQTSRQNSDTKLAGYGFETTPDQRAKVEAYIGKNLSDKDLKAARSNQTYFYTLLDEATADDV